MGEEDARAVGPCPKPGSTLGRIPGPRPRTRQDAEAGSRAADLGYGRGRIYLTATRIKIFNTQLKYF